MATVLVTFSGKLGDIIWTLPAARELHRQGHTVDFATMQAYAAVHPLLGLQPYLRYVFALPEWRPEHDWCGAQPRIPPLLPKGYDRTVHLTYWERPRKPLILHAFEVLDLPVPAQPLPFLEVQADPDPRLVAFAFNGYWMDQKMRVLYHVQEALQGFRFVDVAKLPFDEAARTIQAAVFFLGCRSANYVVAHGLYKRILSIELEPGRREEIFSCPFGREVLPGVNEIGQFVATALAWAQGGDA